MRLAGVTHHYCCSGYAIDLVVKLQEALDISVDIHLVGDGQYGSKDHVSTTVLLRRVEFIMQCAMCYIVVLLQHGNTSGGRHWNGMVGELLEKKADLIVAPMTIDPERAADIAFSKPFKYQGFTVLVKKVQHNLHKSAVGAAVATEL